MISVVTDVPYQVGAAAAHWVEGGAGIRQSAHCDFPVNLTSTGWWAERGAGRVLQLTTRHQLEHQLPKHSLQLLVACHDMDARNGSTEVASIKICFF